MHLVDEMLLNLGVVSEEENDRVFQYNGIMWSVFVVSNVQSGENGKVKKGSHPVSRSHFQTFVCRNLRSISSKIISATIKQSIRVCEFLPQQCEDVEESDK